MDFDPEKFLKDIKSTCDKQCNSSSNPSGSCFRFCFAKCPLLCKSIYVEGPLFLPHVVLSPPPPPPLQPPRTRVFVPNPLNEVAKVTQKHLLTSSLIIMACLIGATILVCILASIMKFRRRYNSRSSRSLRPIFFGTQEDFLDEDQGPEIDHHIWYIQTIGLPQSVIDSISVFKFDKHEGLIDGTECSVCLNEFQDDENLRLLPKCSHAFHISCIDTWLRSHKNCPLCRAPIVSSDFNVHVELSVPDSSDLSSNQESEMTDLDSPSGGMIVVSERIRHDGSSGLRNGDDHDHTNCGLPTEDETGDENEKRASDLSISRDRSRVRSDLVESRVIAETEMQPMRRSASLDSASAMVIYNAVANAFPSKSQRDSVMQQVKNSKSKHVSKRISTGSMSFRKLIKSSSIGHALQKAPISMKRSSSSNSRHSRIQDSILPI